MDGSADNDDDDDDNDDNDCRAFQDVNRGGVMAQWYHRAACRRAPTLDINLGPSVQTHRTAGFNFEKGQTHSLQPLPITKDRFSHITITLIPPPQHPAPVTSRQTVEGPAMSPSRSPTSESGRHIMPRALVPAARSGD